VSGGATLADARIALIVDCDALVDAALATAELRVAA
jgi:chemotaxis protein histidine kinase CheA